MNAADGYIEFTDDRSDEATQRIQASKPLGLIAQRNQHPVWLGQTGAATNQWHPRLRRSGPVALPTVVSFYTPDTAYESLAAILRNSCERFGVQHRIEPRAARGSWEQNCAMKASFVRDMRSEIPGPLLWVDADAQIAAPLTDLAHLDTDLAFHLLDGWRALSGTIYFGDTNAARELIDRWCARCEAEPDIWDQIHLDLAWEDTARSSDLRTAWLDERFVKIFDRQHDAARPPVIVHSQASRQQKHEVSGGIRGGEQEPVAAIREARLLARWRDTDSRPSGESVIVGRPDDSAARWNQHRTDVMTRAFQHCSDHGLTRIALVGAGKHTREIALPVSTNHDLRIVCILDDRADEIGPIDSIHVRKIAELPDSVDALVISSDAHESALASRCRSLHGDRLPIVEPYSRAAEHASLSGTGSR